MRHASAFVSAILAAWNHFSSTTISHRGQHTQPRHHTSLRCAHLSTYIMLLVDMAMTVDMRGALCEGLGLIISIDFVNIMGYCINFGKC